jgi:glycosyltransferase involved in cell wall biosynthesis
MRICVVTSIYPPEIGGPATYVDELSKRISSKHEVHVVTYGDPEYERIKGLKEGHFHIHKVAYPKLPKVLAMPYRMLKMTFLINVTLKNHNCDIIYAMDTNLAGIPSIIASKIRGVPVVLKYVGDWAWEISYTKKWTRNFLLEFYRYPSDNLLIWLLKNLQRFVVRSSKCIVVPSNYLKDVIVGWNLKIPIQIIPNAVGRSENAVKKESISNELNLSGKNILTAGRLVTWKGIDTILNSFPELLKSFPDSSLLIAGEGPEENSLKNLSKSLGIEKNVTFLGRIKNSELRRYMRASDVFVLLSLYEGMSHVILEAMLMKVPVIASNVCGNPETIKDGHTGILVEPNDLKAFITGITEIFNAPVKFRNIINNAHEKVLKINSWDNHIEKLNKVFNNCLQ